MEFFSTLEEILQISNPIEKIGKFNSFYLNYKNDKITYNHNQISKIFDNPSFSSICKIVPAIKVPRRRGLKTNKEKAILVHSIAHIEYSAIDLALDHCYRFKNMPKEFYDDWLEVADEEIKHYLMLEKILNSLGYKYGDFEVHSFLFDTSMNTANSLLDRMAVIPRYLEASGLDANPKIIERLSRLDDNFSFELMNALDIILHEEVSHVQKGDKWFKYACQKEKIKISDFYDIVEKYLPGASKKKAFVNIEFRKRAGYSCEEIKVISTQDCE